MPLEIIGPGFGRTGMSSLKQALEHLGFGPLLPHVRGRDHPELLPGWEAAARGDKIDWDEIFRGYRSQTDWPGAKYWRELARHFPHAKVILTVRDLDPWFESVQATIVPFFAARGMHPSAHLNAIAEMGYETIAVQVFDGRMSDRSHAIRIFKQHTARVQSEIPADRLLTFDLREGWQPLCDFLGVAVPDIPFPKTNSSEVFVHEKWKQG